MGELLEELNESLKRRPCKLGRWMQLQTDDFRQDIIEALDNPSYSPERLESAFKKRGADVSSWTIEAHRKGRCACE